MILNEYIAALLFYLLPRIRVADGMLEGRDVWIKGFRVLGRMSIF